MKPAAAPEGLTLVRSVLQLIFFCDLTHVVMVELPVGTPDGVAVEVGPVVVVVLVVVVLPVAVVVVAVVLVVAAVVVEVVATTSEGDTAINTPVSLPQLGVVQCTRNSYSP